MSHKQAVERKVKVHYVRSRYFDCSDGGVASQRTMRTISDNENALDAVREAFNVWREGVNAARCDGDRVVSAPSDAQWLCCPAHRGESVRIGDCA